MRVGSAAKQETVDSYCGNAPGWVWGNGRRRGGCGETEGGGVGAGKRKAEGWVRETEGGGVGAEKRKAEGWSCGCFEAELGMVVSRLTEVARPGQRCIQVGWVPKFEPLP